MGPALAGGPGGVEGDADYGTKQAEARRWLASGRVRAGRAVRRKGGARTSAGWAGEGGGPRRGEGSGPRGREKELGRGLGSAGLGWSGFLFFLFPFLIQTLLKSN